MRNIKRIFLIILFLALSSCSKQPSSGDCYVKIHTVNGGQVGEVWHVDDVVNGVVKYYSTAQIVSENFKSEPLSGVEKFQKEIEGREKTNNCTK